ncbi:membrane protein [Streptomyces polychromogenes]|uniref:Membrane protein n=1 Tax=Streptomyces polychromogenes TaxID=67342 RepID=A0ABN0W3X3_9ACTN
MSEEQRDQSQSPAAPAEPPAGPRPEPIRFFGTSWVDHDNGYALRRAALAAGSLLAAAGGAYLLRLAYEGLEIGNVGPFLSISVIVLFAIATAIAFAKTWESFGRRPAPSSDEAALKGLKTIGFIGSLLAYFLRSLTEAPGEKLHRAEYERAAAEYDRRRSTRTGNPAARRRPKRKK